MRLTWHKIWTRILQLRKYLHSFALPRKTTPISTRRHSPYRAIRGSMLLSCYLVVVLFQTMSRQRKFNRTRDHEKSRFRTVSWVSCVNLQLLCIKSSIMHDQMLWTFQDLAHNVTLYKCNQNKRIWLLIKSLLVEYISNVNYIFYFSYV